MTRRRVQLQTERFRKEVPLQVSLLVSKQPEFLGIAFGARKLGPKRFALLLLVVVHDLSWSSTECAP